MQTRAEGWGLLAGNPTIAFVYLKPHGHMYDYMNSDALVEALAGLLAYAFGRNPARPESGPHSGENSKTTMN